MPDKYMRFTIALIVVFLISSCNWSGSDISDEIAKQFKASGKKSVDLSKVVTGSWEKVCILGPYSDNKASKEMLGFVWNVELKTSISTNDGITLLLFVKGKEILSYTEHSRNKGDFSNLSGKCFSRENALFIQEASPKNGWPGLFHKNKA